MSHVVFGRIETAKFMLQDQQPKIVLLVCLLSPPFPEQMERIDLPLTTLKHLLQLTGTVDAADLRGRILRLQVDVDGEPQNIAGPRDGSWLLNHALTETPAPLVDGSN